MKFPMNHGLPRFIEFKTYNPLFYAFIPRKYVDTNLTMLFTIDFCVSSKNYSIQQGVLIRCFRFRALKGMNYLLITLGER